MVQKPVRQSPRRDDRKCCCVLSVFPFQFYRGSTKVVLEVEFHVVTANDVSRRVIMSSTGESTQRVALVLTAHLQQETPPCLSTR